MKILVFPHDPLIKYVRKGEIKERYWNPQGMFEAVHIVDFTSEPVEVGDVQRVAGEAELTIHSITPRQFWRIPFLAGRVDRLIREIAPDLIRNHAFAHIGALGERSAGRHGIPSVISVHGDNDEARRLHPTLRYTVARYFEVYSYPRADLVITVTDYLHSYVRRYGAKSIETVFNKVDIERFRARSVYALTDEKRLEVLTVTRLELPNKDPNTLIKAIKRLPSARLTLIGSGPDANTVYACIRKEGVEDRVRVIPRVPHSDIPAYYAAADVFAISTGYEGFCIPVLEAMAAGLPVVASRKDPIPEVMGGTGLLVERTPEAFADALTSLYQSETKRAALGLAARARAQTIDGATMERREAELLRGLIETSRQGSGEKRSSSLYAKYHHSGE